jgi:hypothetical protein
MLELIERNTTEEIRLIDARLANHPRAQFLGALTKDCVIFLRRHCSLILPLCTGHYRPESLRTALTELFHASTHVLLHILHACHIPAFPFDVVLTITGLLLTAHCILHEHEIITAFRERFETLINFSEQNREILYEFVSLSAVDMFLNKIMENPQINWRNELPQKILLSFFNLHHHDEDRHDLLKYGKRWIENIRQVYHTTGAIMAHNHHEHFVKPVAEFRFAWQVQQILSQNSEPTAEELNLPVYNDFIDDLHRRIYFEVLKPYESRAKTSYGAAWLFFYSHESIRNVKILQKQLIAAFAVIYNEFRHQPRDINYDMQLALINSMLYSALNKAGQVMTWNEAARKLALELHEMRSYLACNLTPMIRHGAVEEELIRIDSLEIKMMYLTQELRIAQERLRVEAQINIQVRRDVDRLKEQIGQVLAAGEHLHQFYQQQHPAAAANDDGLDHADVAAPHLGAAI